MYGLVLLYAAELQRMYDREDRRKAINRARRRRNFINILSDVQFRQRFRLNKHGFRLLCDDLRKLTTLKGTNLYPLETKVLVTLNFLANGTNQKIVGLSHKIPQRTVSRFVKEVVEAFNSKEMLMKWIFFPVTIQERDKIKTGFQKKFSVPNVIGSIGSTHINILRPSVNGHLYLNRHGTHSIKAHMICDSDLNIKFVNSKFDGSTSYSDIIWKKSLAYTYMRDLYHNGEDSCLLGGADYQWQAWLITPNLQGQSGSSGVVFTPSHAEAHKCIQRCFAALKTRWRCLLKDKPLFYTPPVANSIVVACSVLHNIAQHLGLPIPPIDPSLIAEDNDPPQKPEI